MKDLIVRCSELKKMMTLPKSKSTEFSETTMEWLVDKAFQYVTDYRPAITSRAMEKGKMVEDKSIDLLNNVYFTEYQKNTERKTNDWLTGECDIVEGNLIRDVKSSWSIDTFPKIQHQAEKIIKSSGYDWQGRGYMLLWDKDQFSVDFCLVDTPIELIPAYEDLMKHYVDRLSPLVRVTSTYFDRDKEVEEKMFEQYQRCNIKYKEIVEELKIKNS